ncbi:DNA-binding protein [Kitasatospora sp. NPDC048538]|uniref:DNA-binding protein n=1 Tax=Kitasatospora sp. NPDC048538 TaxID=3155633 RepID=UPI0033EA1758
MIPHGRPTYELEDVARAAGISEATWRRNRHREFTDKVKALPGSERPIIYDASQVDAYLAGEPIPPLPTEPDPADLLTDKEAGKIAGLAPSTIRADASGGRLSEGVERHGRRWWSRATVEEYRDRPVEYRGRTTGAKDRKSRIKPDPRAATVAQQLGTQEADTVTAATVAGQFTVSERTARRIITKARELQAHLQD